MSGQDWSHREGEDAFLLHFVEHAFPGDAPAKLGVAVSGGSDSMALLSLAARVQAHRGGLTHAVTVDHGLREEAAAEARFVERNCRKIGASHETLVWDHGDITGNLQDQARRARYALIADWARRKQLEHVIIGHTADDQAETFLMGLAREAGIDGLAGMRPVWKSDGIHWARPLLSQRRDELRAYLRRNGIDWVEDPSNADDRFTRVKARRILKSLKPLGITVEKLSGVVGNLSSALHVIRFATVEAADEIATTDAGEVILQRGKLVRLAPEVSRRLLIGALRWISGAEHPPRQAALVRVQDAIREKRDVTLMGCRIRVNEATIRITREPQALTSVEGPTDAVWDHRWQLSGPHEVGMSVRALGAAGLRECAEWRDTGHSRAALVVSPAIWRGTTLIAAPIAGMENGWVAEIVAGYRSFLISH